MIIFEKPDGEYRSCACCYSREKVLDILFQAEGHATAVALCANCRRELAEKLKLEEEAQRDYEQSVQYAEYCERFEPTYNPEDGSM